MPTDSAEAGLTARLHASDFARSDANFDSLTLVSDGCLYYTLCSHNIDTHAKVHRLDPSRSEVPECLGDLGEIVGEAGTRSIPQGKSHSPYFEHEGKLYLATHYGFYKPSSNKEEPAETPPGYRPYPGGHFVRYDLAAGTFANLAKAPEGEGILTMTADPARGRLYGLTWPRGHWLVFDLEAGRLDDLGPVSRGGEAGDGETYFCLCRSLGLDPRDGSVYLTNADGEMLVYQPGANQVESTGVSLQRDVFGHWEVHRPGHQGYNWRKVLWDPKRGRFFAIHPRSAYLFSFEPRSREIKVIERLAAQPLRDSGGFEPFRYGYLSLAFGPDGDTLYYLTCVPADGPQTGRRAPTRTHLVTYGLETGRYQDHGVIRLEDGRYPTMPQTLAVHPNGRIYSAPWIERGDYGGGQWRHEQVDLISFENPLA